MEWLIAIGYGYLINIGVFILMAVLIIFSGLLNLKNTEYLNQYLILEETNEELKSVKIRLASQNKSYKVQTDYVIFIPFSGIITFLHFVWIMASENAVSYIYRGIKKKLDILESRLKDK